MPKPNDPCTCGSGKKYKKCCFHEHSKQKSAAAATSGGGSRTVVVSKGGGDRNPLGGHDVGGLLRYCRSEEEFDLIKVYIGDIKQHGTEGREMFQQLAARKCVATTFLPPMSKVLQISSDMILRQVPHEIQQFEQVGQNDYIVELFRFYVDVCCDSLYLAEQDDDHMQVLRKSTPQGMVEHERSFAFEHGYLETYLQTMDKFLSKSLSENGTGTTNGSFSAVDLAAGAGAFTFEYAKHFSGSNKSSTITNVNLTWYPTEWESPGRRRNPFTCLRESLHWMLSDIIVNDNGDSDDDDGGGNRSRKSSYVPATFGLELTLKESWANAAASATDTFINTITTREILFVDAMGKAAHLGDVMRLVGLSTVEYNGELGRLEGKDSKTDGRFAVLLRSDNMRKARSFKSTNLLVETDYDDEKHREQDLLKGLMKRSRVLDLQDKSTWCGFGISEQLHGRCAIVTCTSLLTQVGHRAPDIWKNALDCANTLLASGGILLLHDTLKFGGFGIARIMQGYIARSGLGLELEERSEPIKHDPTSDSWGRMILMVWRKK
jgi:hypothetical protein